MKASRAKRPTWVLLCGALLALTLFLGLCGLGTWQVQRRAWKLALIAQTTERVHAPATPAPGPAQWPGLGAEAYAYRHISASGVWLQDHSSWVQAATELGSGFWLLTPLKSPEGWTVLVNRGFVPTEARAALAEQLRTTHTPVPAGTLTGLLRMSEPGGAFLRKNDAQSAHWYSRDVPALAAAQGLGPVAPYFMDADANPDAKAAEQPPIGGLTVTDFHNNHLVYAATWYTLALMVAWAAWRVAREERARHSTRDLETLEDDPKHARKG